MSIAELGTSDKELVSKLDAFLKNHNLQDEQDAIELKKALVTRLAGSSNIVITKEVMGPLASLVLGGIDHERTISELRTEIKNLKELLKQQEEDFKRQVQHLNKQLEDQSSIIATLQSEMKGLDELLTDSNSETNKFRKRDASDKQKSEKLDAKERSLRLGQLAYKFDELIAARFTLPEELELYSPTYKQLRKYILQKKWEDFSNDIVRKTELAKEQEKAKQDLENLQLDLKLKLSHGQILHKLKSQRLDNAHPPLNTQDAKDYNIICDDVSRTYTGNDYRLAHDIIMMVNRLESGEV